MLLSADYPNMTNSVKKIQMYKTKTEYCRKSVIISLEDVDIYLNKQFFKFPNLFA